MIYDKIDTKLLTLGKPKKFSESEDKKFITPLYYSGKQLDFSLKNKYVIIDGIEENNYGKEFITVKSKEYSDVIETIATQLDLQSPVQSDGTFRATINFKTKCNKSFDDLKNTSFSACISLTFPSTYADESRKTLPIQLKELHVLEILDDKIDFDPVKLKEAM